ncbi:hypothetical protein CKM354_000160600 [Cercospora kikuchii]|uniref:SSCRP protein n=1 Tax=Cercospora kikuchii TaxID=84275 RepID=A0A9P3C8D3_9PEZI|nr:uncharacterized protein CKM354_000160600 [Cercospora kikuchii]GIZ38183.1 hypothetical protein CKM354_000160600 [Cercospora kikuchii]
MQFKNIVASIAAFAVAGVVASPVDVVARAEQAPSKQQVIDSTNAYMKEHAADKLSEADVALINHATQAFGDCWCGCPPPGPPPVFYPGQFCPPSLRWYIGAYTNFPDYHDLWDGGFESKNCVGLINLASCNDGPFSGLNILSGIL